MRGHAAGLGADEADEIGAVDHAVGALARIAADDADRQRMRAGDRILAVERGRDRDLQRLGERDQFGARARGAHAAAGDDHRPLGGLQVLERGHDARVVRRRPERRHARELRLAERLHLGLVGVDLALVAAELQMHRPRRPRGRHAKRLPHHVGKARHVVDGGVELGHRLERRHVVDLLIDLAELGLGIAAAGQRDHRRMREPGVAQPGREIERADHLRGADAGLAGRARVAVRHVGRGLLAVHVQPLDVGAGLHHGEGLAQHRRHVEHVGDAVALEHVGEAFRPAHFSIVSEHHVSLVLVGFLRREALHECAGSAAASPRPHSPSKTGVHAFRRGRVREGA